jgi:hypothetical protein
MSDTASKVTIVVPDARGGSAPTVKKRGQAAPMPIAEQYIRKLMSGAGRDENLSFIHNKVMNFHSLTNTSIEGLKAAITEGDMDEVANVAHKMTRDSGKVGAIKMMRLCIAMQMVGRRGMLESAEMILKDLEMEYLQVKDGLIQLTA